MQPVGRHVDACQQQFLLYSSSVLPCDVSLTELLLEMTYFRGSRMASNALRCARRKRMRNAAHGVVYAQDDILSKVRYEGMLAILASHPLFTSK